MQSAPAGDAAGMTGLSVFGLISVGNAS